MITLRAHSIPTLLRPVQIFYPGWDTFQVLNVIVVSVTGWKERKICGFWDWGRFMGTPLWIIGTKSKVTQDVTTSKIQYDKQSDISLTAYYLICMYTITMYYSVIVATFRRRGRCSDLAKLLPASLTRVTTTCFGYSLFQRVHYSKGSQQFKFGTKPAVSNIDVISLVNCSLEKGSSETLWKK